jgi:hypothetical protein
LFPKLVSESTAMYHELLEPGTSNTRDVRRANYSPVVEPPVTSNAKRNPGRSSPG